MEEKGGKAGVYSGRILKKAAVFGKGCTGIYTAELLQKSGIETVDIFDGKAASGSSEEEIHLLCDIVKNYDGVVDTLSSLPEKANLIQAADAESVFVISCLTLGNRSNPAAYQVCDIKEVSGSQSAEELRRLLSDRGICHLRVVSFNEEDAAVYPDEMPDCEHCTCPPVKARSCVHRRKSIGCNSYVSAMAGMLLGAELLQKLLS